VFTIMESHHGRVEFSSAHGRGTIFTLAFPLTSETPDDAAHHPLG
jgi:signal transduction histidine kinase